MNNVTYFDVNLTPNDRDGETYSKLSTVQQFSTSHLQTQIQHQDKPALFQSELNEINGCNLKTPAYRKKMVLLAVALILLLLLISLVSIAMSVAAYVQSSNYRGKLDITNQELSSVKTQLGTTQINMSHMLTRLYAENERLQTQLYAENERLQIQLYCGPGQWQRVAHLNMSDPTEQCPSVWELYNASAVRACGRPQSDALSNNCPASAYSTNNSKYSRVCGRVIGYQVGTPDAFSNVQNTFNLDGIVISHGIGRNYIWSYVAGQTQNQSSRFQTKCPCTSGGRQPPRSIREKYYCESGNPNANAMQDTVYASDKLWDGQQCEGTCCTGAKYPPWFSVQLSTPTNDTIEVHICCDQSTSDEDTPIELLELYVQ